MWSEWKTSPESANSSWTPPSPFPTPPAANITSVAVGTLPDGRLQVFIASNGQLWTIWKTSPDSNSGWSPLSLFPAPPNISDVTVGRLPDGRLQLFASSNVGTFTAWKTSSDPDASWTNWR
jgi:hypothetical protein